MANPTKHGDGSAQLGRGKTRDLRANSGPSQSGRGGKVGTKAGVCAYDGASGIENGLPKSLGDYRPSVSIDQPKGKGAGGTDNKRANGKRFSGDRMSAPSSGGAKATPTVNKAGGTSVPKRIAKSPK